MRPMWFDMDGDPITLEQGSALLDDIDQRRIALDYVGTAQGTFTVSTVHLVLDHSYGGIVPLLFETMVFLNPLDGSINSEKWGEDKLTLRWSTRQQAEDGHAKLVQDMIEQQGVPGYCNWEEE